MNSNTPSNQRYLHAIAKPQTTIPSPRRIPHLRRVNGPLKARPINKHPFNARHNAQRNRRALFSISNVSLCISLRKENLHSKAHKGDSIKCVDYIPKSLPPFKRRVCFQALEDELITTSIGGITSTPKAISGFPTTIQQLIMNLRLDSPFGTVDHFLNKKPLPTIPRKRSRGFIQGDRRDLKRAGASVYSMYNSIKFPKTTTDTFTFVSSQNRSIDSLRLNPHSIV